MKKSFNEMLFRAKKFGRFNEALKWGKAHAMEHMFPYHFWEVVKVAANRYAVAIKNKNTGMVEAFA